MPRSQQEIRDIENNVVTCVSKFKKVWTASPKKFYNKTSRKVRPTSGEHSEEVAKILLKPRNFYDKDFWSFENVHCLTQAKKKVVSRFLYKKIGLDRTMGVYQAGKMTDKLLGLYSFASSFKINVVDEEELSRSKKYLYNPHSLNIDSFDSDLEIQFDIKKITQSFKGDKYFKIGRISPLINNRQFNQLMELKGEKCISVCASFFGDIKDSFHYSV